VKALIVSGNLFEDTELLVPWYRLLEENIEVDIASVQVGVITGKHGYTVTAGFSLEAIVPDYYDLLILPGGKAPAQLRKQEPLLEIVRHFFAENKTVAAICHGPQILVSAGVLTDRKATCYQGVAEEVKDAGAEYLDEEVVLDGNLITSRIPSDLPAFCRELMKQYRLQL
jgi:protease I